jgi:hypothetical protein
MVNKQGEQGTGRHPHKDSEEPYSHSKQASGEKKGDGEHSGRSEASSRSQESSQREGSQHSRGGSSDDQSLKQREYKDAHGDVHHHTKSYMDQHDKK